ncbi:MAG: ribonuclease R [Streptococcaceae bacterium]|jgi:ribonuclease R|nr:ribonuclease R [Streptococcaceae bacterium]
MKEKILNYLRQKKKMSVTTKEMATDLGLTAARDFRELIKLLAVMETERLIDFTDFGTISLHSFDPEIVGTFHANAAGFGFVTISSDEPDVFVAKGQTDYAMDGDEVAIILSKTANPLAGTAAEGKVTAIKSHKQTRIVGLFERTDVEGFVGQIVNRDRKFNWQILVSDKGLKAQPGQVVSAEIISFPNEKFPKTVLATVVKIIGNSDDQGIDVLEVLEGKGIRSEFPEAVKAEVAALPSEISAADLLGREDFRSEVVYSIDGADAKDLDDAIHVKALKNGHYELGVHIADVSHYVKLGTAVDKEALERGTSVYVTDRVVPMLPEALSNGICSLNPQVDRLVQSCIMEIDQIGRVVNHRIVHGVIKTTYRMTYDDVNMMIQGDESALAKFYKITDSVQNAVKLHKILETMRRQRGALDFAENEARILVDDKGRPTEIVRRERGTAERMIESFMLAANESVAEHFSRLNLPFIYRIHEHPKAEKLQKFIDLASTFGVKASGTASHMEQKNLQEISRSIQGQPFEQVLSILLLRSMQQARYSAQNDGHFGLAAEYYTHFTSPIRRYPDLLVHRLIDDYLVNDAKAEFWAEKIPEIAQQSSSRERRAVDAEREVDKMKKAEYMSAFVAQEFDGIVSSVTSFGAFVELPNTVEGLIHVNSFKKEYLRFDERNLTLRSEKTGLTLRIGQPIKIKLARADKLTGEIDFEYVKSDLDVFEKSVNSGKSRRKRRNASDKSLKSSKAVKSSKKSSQHPYTLTEKKPKQAYYKKVAKKQQRRRKK